MSSAEDQGREFRRGMNLSLTPTILIATAWSVYRTSSDDSRMREFLRSLGAVHVEIPALTEIAFLNTGRAIVVMIVLAIGSILATMMRRNHRLTLALNTVTLLLTLGWTALHHTAAYSLSMYFLESSVVANNRNQEAQQRWEKFLERHRDLEVQAGFPAIVWSSESNWLEYLEGNGFAPYGAGPREFNFPTPNEDQYQAIKSLVTAYFENGYDYFPVTRLKPDDRAELAKRFAK